MKKVFVGCGFVIVLLLVCTLLGTAGWVGYSLLTSSDNAPLNTPAAILATFTSESGTIPTLTPEEGNALPTLTPSAPTSSAPLSTPTLQPGFTPAVPPLHGKAPYRAVVQIVAEVANEGGDLVPEWSGSGTIVDPRGFILTNAHVALPTEEGERVDALLILLTAAEDRPPKPEYFATVMQADPDLDLAVLRITTDLDGNPVDNNRLNLPYVRLGDSDKLHLGEPLIILGYPGIGGNTITLTRGEVSGFTAERPYGRRAFIKTSATIAGGNSGGLAIDNKGEFVAIPTQLGSGSDSDVVDCRYLADTNGDGVIDEDDDCVPSGGFINALRPINLAKPLIAAALRGEVSLAPTAAPQATSGPAPQGTPVPLNTIIFRDDFSNPNSGWTTFSDDDGEIAYLNGQLRVHVTSENMQIWSRLHKSLQDVVMVVDASKVGGDDNNDLGLICRYQDVDHFYYLAIGSDGYYQIFRIESDDFVGLLNDGDWSESDAIRQGNATNHLRAECVGDSLRLYVNGVLLGEAIDDAYPRGDVGLSASAYDKPGTDIRFDNFVLARP